MFDVAAIFKDQIFQSVGQTFLNEENNEKWSIFVNNVLKVQKIK